MRPRPFLLPLAAVLLLALPGALADEGPGPQIELVGSYDTGYAEGVVVAGGYAYVTDNSAGLVVVNVSDSANPTGVGSYYSNQTHGVAVAGSYAYVADGYRGLVVIDVSDPANPTWAGGYDTSGSATGVAVSGDYAYVADGYNGLVVVDVSDPANPTFAGGYDTSDYAVGVAVAGGYAYVADRVEGLVVVDVSDPTNPNYAGGYGTSGIAWGVAVAGSYAYVADGYNGLVVVDVSDPANPTWAGGYDTPYYAVGVAVAGGYAYVADEETGLVVMGADSDGDGVADMSDLFPSDPEEWADGDSDGVGDNGDLFPSDPAASVDSDGDGHPDEWNPGMLQSDSTTGLHLDFFPSDPDEWSDTDGDGVGNNGDPLPSNPMLKAWWQVGLILATFGIATYSASYSFLTRRAFREADQALAEWESAGVNTGPVRELLAEGSQKWGRFNHPAAMALAAQAKEKGEEHARGHGNVKQIVNRVEEVLQGYEAEGVQVGPVRDLLEQARSAWDEMDFQKAEELADRAWTKGEEHARGHGNVKQIVNRVEEVLQGYEAEGVQVGPVRDLLEQARSAWDEMDFQKAEELARQAETEGEELESQYQAAVEKVTELKAKIAEFKEKGVNTDELEKILEKVEAEIGTASWWEE